MIVMKLNIQGKTVAAQGHKWDDNTQQGVAIVAGYRVRFFCETTENANFNPFYYGYVLGNDVALVPADYLARLTKTCFCGNTITPEEEFCLYCRELSRTRHENAERLFEQAFQHIVAAVLKARPLVPTEETVGDGQEVLKYLESIENEATEGYEVISRLLIQYDGPLKG